MHLVWDRFVQAQRAAKVFQVSAGNYAQIAQMINEARLAANLNHENLVRLYDFDPELFYITMEYCDGGDLRSLIRSRAELTIREKLRLVWQIAMGLQSAHSNGVIHRDLKPGNVLLARGIAKIADFGLAKKPGTDATVTQGGAVGTYHYSSPEQLASKALDARADLWSLGVVLFEILTWQRPFGLHIDPIGDVGDRIARGAVIAPQPALPVPLAALIKRCLQVDPARRFQNAGEFLRELSSVETALNGQLDRPWPPADSLDEVDLLAQRLAKEHSSLSDRDRDAILSRLLELGPPDDSAIAYWREEQRKGPEEESGGLASGADLLATYERLREDREAGRWNGLPGVPEHIDQVLDEIRPSLGKATQALAFALHQRLDAARARADEDLDREIKRAQPELLNLIAQLRRLGSEVDQPLDDETQGVIVDAIRIAAAPAGRGDQLGAWQRAIARLHRELERRRVEVGENLRRHKAAAAQALDAARGSWLKAHNEGIPGADPSARQALDLIEQRLRDAPDGRSAVGLAADALSEKARLDAARLEHIAEQAEKLAQVLDDARLSAVLLEDLDGASRCQQLRERLAGAAEGKRPLLPSEGADVLVALEALHQKCVEAQSEAARAWQTAAAGFGAVGTDTMSGADDVVARGSRALASGAVAELERASLHATSAARSAAIRAALKRVSSLAAEQDVEFGLAPEDTDAAAEAALRDALIAGSAQEIDRCTAALEKAQPLGTSDDPTVLPEKRRAANKQLHPVALARFDALVDEWRRARDQGTGDLSELRRSLDEARWMLVDNEEVPPGH